jgi:transposase InsO family protein
MAWDTSRAVDQWAYQNQVALHFIERGKPTQNALIKSFNGKLRDECLNQNWFVDLRHALTANSPGWTRKQMVGPPGFEPGTDGL